MKRTAIYMAITLFFLSSCNFAWRSFHSVTGVQKVTKEELRDVLDDPGVTILDVRDTADWEGSNYKIPGAIRENPYNVESWAEKYNKGQNLILYCA